MVEVSLIEQFIDSDLFDVVKILTALLVVPFLIRFQRDKESDRKKLQLLLSTIPFVVLLLMSAMY